MLFPIYPLEIEFLKSYSPLQNGLKNVFMCCESVETLSISGFKSQHIEEY